MAHEETIRDLIEGCLSIAGGFAKEELLHRQETERIEMEKEKEVELAKIQQRTGGSESVTETTEAVVEEGPPVTGAEAAVEIDRLMDEETCSTCRQLLKGLRDRPPREQIRGVMEYGQFKKELSEGADAEELKAILRDTEVLASVFEEDIRGRPI